MGAESAFDLPAALVMPSQAVSPPLGPHLPAGPPWGLGWASVSPRWPGDSMLQGLPFPQCLHCPLCSCEKSQCSLPAGWICSLALPEASALSDGDAGFALSTLQGPRTPWGCRAPHQSSTRPPQPIAVRISRQDAGKSFLLRRSVRMGASLPAELRQPVAQLPALHTCSARLR